MLVISKFTAMPYKLGLNWEICPGKTGRFGMHEMQEKPYINNGQAERSSEGPSSAQATYRIDVLIVEDNQANQMVFSRVMETMNASYEVADNGKQAIADMIKFRPAVILMDVSMPVMDGLEATRSIRGLTRGTESFADYNPYIIGATANVMERDKLECFDAGMDDYMSKPVSPAELREKLTRKLAEKGLRDLPLFAERS